MRISTLDSAFAWTVGPSYATLTLETKLALPPETGDRLREAIHFRAPWSTGLKVSSFIVAGLLIWASVYVASTLPSHWSWSIPMAVYLPGGPVLLLLFGLFTIRGYSLTPHNIVIHRLLWETTLSLAGLESIKADPNAMKGSIRLFGNGGALSFTGFYLNRRLGRYRAFATDPARAVVLEFPSRKVVVTPQDPNLFISSLQERSPDSSVGKESHNGRMEPTIRQARDGCSPSNARGSAAFLALVLITACTAPGPRDAPSGEVSDKGPQPVTGTLYVLPREVPAGMSLSQTSYFPEAGSLSFEYRQDDVSACHGGSELEVRVFRLPRPGRAEGLSVERDQMVVCDGASTSSEFESATAGWRDETYSYTVTASGLGAIPLLEPFVDSLVPASRDEWLAVARTAPYRMSDDPALPRE